ncbi:hypothetical protein EU527_18455 [Candidatus Thorarchaeota archaeon]|nr:MAG: hypothetical protein EU527_18455 [Candidatus Thorarchaeota archaeon]
MGWKEILQVVLFLLAWVPVSMLAGYTLLGAEPTYAQDFSIYNDNWNGLNQFRISIEETRDVYSIQASMSVTTRENGSAVLMIIGPVRDFSLDVTLVIYTHLLNGGGVLIADDFGTANSSLSLLNYLMSGMMPNSPLGNQTKGLLSFTGGVLLDLASYDPIKEPRLPIITDFTNPFGFRADGGFLTQNVNELHLNYASAISPYSLIGQAGIAWSSVRSWCETNITDNEPEYNPDYEWSGPLPVAGALDFSSPTNPNGGRIVAISDPSIFTNDMFGRFPDNRQFAANIIEWLSHSDTSQPVLFCEQLLAVPPNTSEFFFGLYLGRVLWMSSLPYISALYPLLTAIGIKKYLPELKKPEVKSVSDVFLRRGQTYFGERMSYYRTEGNYARVVKMLFRKMKRGLKKQQQMTEFSNKKLWELMRYNDPKLKEAEFFNMIDRIEEISANPNMKIKENEMMEFFFFMRNIESLLIDTRK